MRKIVKARHSGFCSGVDTAFNTALKVSGERKNVFVLGLLVHNAMVIKQLEDRGIKSVSSLAEIPDPKKATVIISAHGAGPVIYAEAEKLGIDIVDTTCPWVRKAQRIAKELSDSGAKVFIVGDRSHAEVKGIMEWAQGNATVLESPSDLRGQECPSKAGVLAQTTQSKKNFDLIVTELLKLCSDLQVHNTICGATSQRQESAVETAMAVDAMIVIGDKRSANTKRLFELCSATGTPAYWIQSARELDLKSLKDKEKIGITAGASTPDGAIDEVVNALSS